MYLPLMVGDSLPIEPVQRGILNKARVIVNIQSRKNHRNAMKLEFSDQQRPLQITLVVHARDSELVK